MTTSHLRRLASVSVMALFVGSAVACTSAVRSFKVPDFGNRVIEGSIHVRVVMGEGATSIGGSGAGGIAAIQVLQGGDAVLSAAQRVRLELLEIGFSVTDSSPRATMYADLTLSPRYDPLGGWIADEAALEFIDASNGDLLASYRASGSGLVTPSVNNLMSNLMKDLRVDYKVLRRTRQSRPQVANRVPTESNTSPLVPEPVTAESVPIHVTENADAQYNLGVMYKNGDGVPQDYAEAYFWFNLAATYADASDRDQFVGAREAAAKLLTPEQLADTQRRAREFFEAHPPE